MHEAADIARRAISENTEKTYQSLLKRYSDGLSRIPDAPPAFPVTAQSIITYLTFRKTMEHCSLNTIKGDLSAIRRHLHIYQLPDVTQSTLVRAARSWNHSSGMRITRAISAFTALLLRIG